MPARSSLLSSPCLEAALGITGCAGASTEPRAPSHCAGLQTATSSHGLQMLGSSSQPQELQSCEDQPSTPQKPVLHIPVLLPPPALPVMLAHRP